ncbi:MAG TPA: HPr family phosphocarrier protein [Chthoniobacteraceae bacterium]|jgi:phosphocarrier protein HPr|nr:Phosphotransferase system, phosphocarrier protein HPr [Chthoniobacter sp.]HEV7868233.1 HPr family phosphocarrier protein [Chthoniobacteraceae bacterium]
MGFLSRKSDIDSKVSRTLTIINRLGMHARPSAMFVKAASRFRCEVWVEKDGERVNGKSIMGLMMLAAGQGSKLLVTCEGADAEKALNEIESIIARKFDED